MLSDCVVSSSGDKIQSAWVPPAGPLLTGPKVATPALLPQSNLDGSEESDSKDSSEGGKNDLSQSDAEGVWSPDIETAFHEALSIYPPCGRRKIILSESGKMYGRNELIARHIKLRTGQNRTRKQVSSHIQVLARRKAKEIKLNLKNQTKEKTFQPLSSLSCAQIVFATANQNNAPAAELASPVNYSRTSWEPGITQPGTSEDIQHFQSSQSFDMRHKPPVTVSASGVDSLRTATVIAYEGRAISIPHKIHLVEFSAFMEKHRDPENYSRHLFIHIGDSPIFSDHSLETVDIREICDKFPEDTSDLLKTFDKGPGNAFFLIKFWTDINTEIQDEPGDFYGVNTEFRSSENMTITCSTKVCSFGKVVVEKVKTEYGRFENGNFIYKTHRAPMCDYVVNFIRKLKRLPEHYMMNSVLEHFSILCVVVNRDTQETLLCVAFVFEVSESEHGAQHHIYRLVKG